MYRNLLEFRDILRSYQSRFLRFAELVKLVVWGEWHTLEITHVDYMPEMMCDIVCDTGISFISMKHLHGIFARIG